MHQRRRSWVEAACGRSRADREPVGSTRRPVVGRHQFPAHSSSDDRDRSSGAEVTDSDHRDPEQPTDDAGISEADPGDRRMEGTNGMTGGHDRPVGGQSALAGRHASSTASRANDGLPIKMLHDRILVRMEGLDGDRTSSGGILIPATAQVGKRLTWAKIVAAGPSVRSMELGDRVLFNPEDRYEVEVGGRDYIILRERDIHAVAAERLDDSPTGLYL